MDNRIPPVRSDVITVPSAARPTPTPVRVSFGEVLAKGAGALVNGAESALEMLPGGPLVAAAIRGGGSSLGAGSSTMSAGGFGTMGGSNLAEGPSAVGGSSVGGGFGAGGATGTGTGTGGVGTGSLDQSLQQSQEMNLYFLQIQQQVNAQNQTFTTLSNVMKSEADTIKNAIGNLR